MKKKFVIAVLVLLLSFMSFNGQTLANGIVSESVKITDKGSKMEVIRLDSLDLDNIPIEKTYTYDEVLADMLSVGLISEREYLEKSL